MTMTIETTERPQAQRRVYPDVVAGAATKTRAMARKGERALGEAVGAAIAARRRLDRDRR